MESIQRLRSVQDVSLTSFHLSFDDSFATANQFELNYRLYITPKILTLTLMSHNYVLACCPSTPYFQYFLIHQGPNDLKF